MRERLRARVLPEMRRAFGLTRAALRGFPRGVLRASEAGSSARTATTPTRRQRATLRAERQPPARGYAGGRLALPEYGATFDAATGRRWYAWRRGAPRGGSP